MKVCNKTRRPRPASNPRTTHLSLAASVARFCAITAIAMIALAGDARADTTPTLKVKRTVKIDEVGDGHGKLEIKMPAQLYTIAKTNNPNTAVFLRRMGAGQDWRELTNVRGAFDDSASTVVIEYTMRGLARCLQDDLWEIPLDAGELDLVGTFDDVIVFNSAAQTDLGLASGVEHVEVPKPAESLKYLRGPNRLQYRLATPQQGGYGGGNGSGNAAHEFRFESRPRVISAFAKLYSREAFSHLWVARAVLKNTGDETLSDYRVRFRISEFSSWSPWMRAKKVLPGQTVVDAYFPVLDLDKLATLTGTRPASLEIEYEYRQADGAKVTESDSRHIDLLGPNEVVFSSLTADEAVGFFDLTNYAPLILAAYVTSNDPVIQQLAGAVCGRAGGPAASLSTEDAIKYVEHLYKFLSDSRIAYQTPPGRAFEGQFGQHVKYGRDVLRNRAGTCIDLTILFASACDAVGLEPLAFVIPGHAFPAVRLPNGKIIAIESTMIGRKSCDEAYKRGMEQMEAAVKDGRVHIVEIRKLHEMGVRALDLPTVSEDFLTKLGYDLKAPAQQPAPPAPPATRTPNSVVAQTASPLVGTWGFQGNVNGFYVVGVTRLMPDGQFLDVCKVTGGSGTTMNQETAGTYQVQGNSLVFRGKTGTTVTRQFEFRSNGLLVSFPELGQSLLFQRME